MPIDPMRTSCRPSNSPVGTITAKAEAKADKAAADAEAAKAELAGTRAKLAAAEQSAEDAKAEAARSAELIKGSGGQPPGRQKTEREGD